MRIAGLAALFALAAGLAVAANFVSTQDTQPVKPTTVAAEPDSFIPAMRGAPDGRVSGATRGLGPVKASEKVSK